jgi:methyl-accepting chemotaxis protein
VLTAEPLARRLLPAELPAAIAAQSRRVEAASAAFARTDRTSSGFVWAILVLSGVCGTALFSSLARDLLASVGALKVGAERFGAGELGHRVAVGRCDELDEVGESLNTMAARLRQARDELEVRNQELAQLAFRDPLTRLANRALFREHVGRSLAQRGVSPARWPCCSSIWTTSRR